MARPEPATPAATTLSARQAQAVATLAAFLRAFNAGEVDTALATFGEPLSWSDCDYARGVGVSGTSRDSLGAWLRQRAADHDRLTLGEVTLGGPDGLIVGASFAHRASDTLRARGFPEGIAPQLAAKVVFDYSNPASGSPRGLIGAFANGTVGGPTADCDPATYRRSSPPPYPRQAHRRPERRRPPRLSRPPPSPDGTTGGAVERPAILSVS